MIDGIFLEEKEDKLVIVNNLNKTKIFIEKKDCCLLKHIIIIKIYWLTMQVVSY